MVRFWSIGSRGLPLVIILLLTQLEFSFGYEPKWLDRGPGLTGYEIKERIDYKTGLVFLERWYDNYYLGIEKVLTLDEYLDYLANKSIKKSFGESQAKERKKQEIEFGTQGLIPDIQLPKLPIFGEGSKINISGSDRITFGGRQTTVYGPGITPTATSQSALPELKMEQELRVNLDGTIGDKTKILIDHDSKRQFEGKNKIKLSYTGTEDEIIQSVEMGDTRLYIPGTGYTGDLPAHKGLFGITAKGKLGGLDLYAVASTEQSQAQTAEFRGRTQMTTDTIYDNEFERRRFYVIDTLATGEVTNLLIYLDQRIANPQNYRNGIATTNPQDPADTSMGSKHRVKGKFILLKLGEDYYRHSNNVIELRNQLDRDDILAVSYLKGTDTIGGNLFVESPRDTYLVLKLLKPSYVDTSSPCWNYELRNIYRLGAQEVKLESLKIYLEQPDIDLEYDPVSRRSFISILGLDPDGDGKITWPEYDARNGLIIFPYRFPFALPQLSVKDSMIYRQDPLPPNFVAKYYIVANYSSARGSFYIGQTDIEEGSEKVFVNQELWTRGVDYDINYQTGELSFKRTLPPNADIRVTFEYRPWFSTSQKSLLGTRAEWKFIENGKIGSSLFYRSEGLPGDKPELGAEPFRRMISEADISYSTQSQAVSSFFDRLPLLRAEAPSSFQISSEVAVSLPDPNTRGLVYLDDFEGSTMSNDISINVANWFFSSVPVGKDTANFARTPLKWFNPTTRIRKDSIFGSEIGREGSETVDYLRIIFTPDNTSSWAGITNCPSQLGMDFRELENIEVILRTRNRTNGRIHFSIGSNIDEDVPRRTAQGTIAGYNGIEDTEDRNRNGVLDKVEGEDTGLDTVIGVDGQNVFGDDGNDDYDAKTNPNGTENNGKLDYEDLDRNGFSRSNDYFEYSVDLGDARFQPLRGDWRFLRISLTGSDVDTVGSPRWEEIRLVRIWFDGFVTTDTIDIYSIAFVGSKWRDVVIRRDTIFYSYPDPVDSSEKATLSQISIKSNPNYIPPFEPKRDYTGQVEIEASLRLEYETIKPGHLVSFAKYIYDREDYRDYRVLKIYLHNDWNDPVFFLKIGTDSLNYYEYRNRISQGKLIPGRTNWYEFEIPLDTFPALKVQRNLQTGYFYIDNELGTFAIMGNPNLAEVRYQVMGIVNNSGAPISGEIWFNDIRLHNPRKDAGYGLQSRIGLNLSDFSTFSFGISYNDPNFRRFSEGRGVKTGGFATNTSYDWRINLDRLLPKSWNFNLPLSYRKIESKTLPKYSANYPDLLLSKDNAVTQATIGENTTWSLDNVRKGKSGNRLLNYTIEAFAYSWRLNKGYSDAPLDSSLSYSLAQNLNYGISPDLKVRLFGEEINLFPQNIQTGVSVAKSIIPRFTKPRPETTWTYARADSSYAGTFDFDANYSPIGDLSFDYSFSQERDFMVQNHDKLPVGGIKIGQAMGEDQNFGASYGLEIGEVISPRVDFNSEYREDRLRSAIARNYENKWNLGNGRDIDFTVDIELSEILSGLAKLRDERKDSSAMPGSPHWLLMQTDKLAEMIEPIDFGYSKARTSDFLNVTKRPDWKYRFGLVDYLTYDTAENRDYIDNINISSGATIKDLSLRFRFDHSINKGYSIGGATGSWSTTWPDLSISIARIERFLKNWATSSNINTSYSRRTDRNGNLDLTTNTLLPTGQTKSIAHNFSPLLAWQASWKRRISTNLSFSYSKSQSENIDIQTKTNNEQKSGSFSLSYLFSAPQGIKIPGLKKIRFSSDLNLTWSLRLSENYSDLFDQRIQTTPMVNRKDRDITTSISASYRVSRSVESGLNTGYTLYKNIQRGTASRSIDLNFWVLFNF
ncbi:MAG: hypothetical protein ABIK93_07655 [candidate division WOR-3 bacterium]